MKYLAWLYPDYSFRLNQNKVWSDKVVNQIFQPNYRDTALTMNRKMSDSA